MQTRLSIMCQDHDFWAKAGKDQGRKAGVNPDNVRPVSGFFLHQAIYAVLSRL
jgi:hypothetical protein